MELLSSKVKDSMHFVEYNINANNNPNNNSFRKTNLYKNLKLKPKELTKEKRWYFLYRLFCPKKTFFASLFYLNVRCIEHTFRI